MSGNGSHTSCVRRCTYRASVVAPIACPSCTRRASVFVPIARLLLCPSRAHLVPVVCLSCVCCCTPLTSVARPSLRPSCAHRASVVEPVVRPLLCPSCVHRCTRRHIRHQRSKDLVPGHTTHGDRELRVAAASGVHQPYDDELSNMCLLYLHAATSVEGEP